jgi:glutamate-ammonia-ligase adenylyltransferase
VLPEKTSDTGTNNLQTSEIVKQVVDSSADPSRVSRYFDELEKRHPGAYREIAVNPGKLGWLGWVFASSKFLSEELLRHPHWILGLGEMSRTFSGAEYNARFADFLRQVGASKASGIELALFRRKELLRLVIRDLTGMGELAELTGELSSLADAILGCALSEVEAELIPRFGRPLEENKNDVTAAFSVLALGKLGGRELNYSSDIDLMFLYSANGETSGPHVITNKEFFQKLANQFTSLLSTHTPAGLCYRVDLRLRPEGSHGEVCISMAAAREYYQKRARDWELQMLLKARVAAGNELLGQDFLQSVEPLIYSTTLDFTTVETMSATRVRIGEKAANKAARGRGIDVKLTSGGIRDIEFLVQCLQRLHGNRQSAVKHQGTLLALSCLHDYDLLSATEYSRLESAYRFLRRLEHVLQFEDDRQTHLLPSNAAELEYVARRISRNGAGTEPSAATHLLRELNQHLENVQTIYERIVHAQRPLYYTLPASYHSMPEPPEPPQKQHELLESSLPDDLAEKVGKVVPALLERIRAGRGRSLKNGLADFLEWLVQNPVEAKLLSERPALGGWIIQLFESSPLLANQLLRYPELLDEIRRAADFPERRYAFEALAAPLNDIEGLGWFFRREMFRTQAVSVCLPQPVFQTLDQTSALAEFVIARAYRIALEMGLDYARRHAVPDKPFEEPKNELMVVALGRLGMREFDLGSDADLLFIIPDSEADRHRFWTRVVERLLEILSGYSERGPIVSVDTRLRPDGREGPLVQSESRYVDYFANKAEAWEGIAYMKARGVAGDTDRATKFLTNLQQVDWRRYGQGGRSKLDLRQMRLRLQREQGTEAPLKAAQGGYYDADFILMYLRLRGAGMFFKSLNTPERIDIVEKMGHLERVDAEFLLEATTYFRALDHAIRLVTGHAQGKMPASPEQCEMVAELMNRWTSRHSTAANLDSDLLALQTRMHRLFERVFA